MLSIKVFCTRLHLQLWISARSGATLPTQAATNLMWVFPVSNLLFQTLLPQWRKQIISSQRSFPCPAHQLLSEHCRGGGNIIYVQFISKAIIERRVDVERRSLKLFYCTAFLYWPALQSSLNWRFILFLSGLMVGWGKFPHLHCIVFY